MITAISSGFADSGATTASTVAAGDEAFAKMLAAVSVPTGPHGLDLCPLINVPQPAAVKAEDGAVEDGKVAHVDDEGSERVERVDSSVCDPSALVDLTLLQGGGSPSSQASKSQSVAAAAEVAARTVASSVAHAAIPQASPADIAIVEPDERATKSERSETPDFTSPRLVTVLAGERRPLPGTTFHSVETAPLTRTVPMHISLQHIALEVAKRAEGAELVFDVRPATLGRIAVRIASGEEGRTLSMAAETPQAAVALQQAEAMLARQSVAIPFAQISVDLNTSARGRGSKPAPAARIKPSAQGPVIRTVALPGRYA